jgi:elongation factor Ts
MHTSHAPMRRSLGVIVAAALLVISLVIFRKRQNRQAQEEMGATDRAPKRGGIFSYVHHNNRLGVLLELNCNTDIVAQSERFLQLANELAIQIAATDPKYINFEDVPTDVVEQIHQVILQDPSMERVPPQKRNEVINSKLKKVLGEQVLMMQSWVKDETVIVGDLVKSGSAEMGENVVLRRFRRYVLGDL